MTTLAMLGGTRWPCINLDKNIPTHSNTVAWRSSPNGQWRSHVRLGGWRRRSSHTVVVRALIQGVAELAAHAPVAVEGAARARWSARDIGGMLLHRSSFPLAGGRTELACGERELAKLPEWAHAVVKIPRRTRDPNSIGHTGPRFSRSGLNLVQDPIQSSGGGAAGLARQHSLHQGTKAVFRCEK